MARTAFAVTALLLVGTAAMGVYAWKARQVKGEPVHEA